MGARNFTGVRKVARAGKARWFIDFRFTDRGGVRQRFRRDATVQNHSAAIAEAARLMRRAAETGVVEEAPVVPEEPKPTITYASFVAGTFSAQFVPQYRPATARRYRELHAQRVLAFFGEKPLDAIGIPELRTFAAALRADGVQTRGPLNLVRTVLRAAHESGQLEAVPELPSGLIATSRKLPSAPSPEEVEAMLGAEGWVGLAIALAALAGLRMGEVRALEVRDVDFEQHRLLVRRALSDEVSLTPKSGQERTVPLAAHLETLLRETTKGRFPRQRVLLDEEDQTPTRQWVLYKFKCHLRRANVKEWSFHSLRHFFVTQLMRSGTSAEVVRVLAGHSKLEMTQRYAHAEAPDLRAAIDKLGK